jgi:hypothetical protein
LISISSLTLLKRCPATFEWFIQHILGLYVYIWIVQT